MNNYDSQNLQGADFRGKRLEGAHFDDANLESANFAGADLYWGNFFRAHCKRGNFAKADLRGADLKQADFSDANLCGANLGSDNLNGETQVEGTVFENAIYDSNTIFPNPVPQGGNFKIQVTVEAKTKDIRKDSKGRYVFSYETGHSAFFVLPKGHAIVYSNFPVLVYEKQEKTVLQVKKGKEHNRLLFKTRAFSTK